MCIFVYFFQGFTSVCMSTRRDCRDSRGRGPDISLTTYKRKNTLIVEDIFNIRGSLQFFLVKKFNLSARTIPPDPIDT